MAKKKSGSGIRLVVTSAVKDFIRDAGLRSEGGLEDAVSAKVEAMLSAAADRCKANGRQTVRGEDL